MKGRPLPQALEKTAGDVKVMLLSSGTFIVGHARYQLPIKFLLSGNGKSLYCDDLHR